MYNNKINNSSGFTLIEIIASFALLALVITLLLPIFPQIFQWTSKAENELTASNLIGQVAYEMKNDSSKVQSDFENIRVCEPGVNYEKVEEETHFDFYYNKKYEAKYQLLCKEDPVNLYRTKLIVYEENNKPISKSYTYLKSEE